MAHDLPVLARAGLGLVRVNDEVARSPVRQTLRHEAPLEPGREAGASPSAKSARLHLADDPVPPHEDEVLRAVPVPALHRALEKGVVLAVQVGENPVLVREVSVGSLRLGARGGELPRRAREGQAARRGKPEPPHRGGAQAAHSHGRHGRRRRRRFLTFFLPFPLAFTQNIVGWAGAQDAISTLSLSFQLGAMTLLAWGWRVQHVAAAGLPRGGQSREEQSVSQSVSVRERKVDDYN